jgi:hypothetical protein
MVGLVEVTWRFDGSRFFIEIVRGGEVLYSTARDVRELEISIADMIGGVFKKNRRYTRNGMVTKTGMLVSAVGRHIISTMDIWAIDAIIKSGIYPLCYKARRLSHDNIWEILDYLSSISSERIVISGSDVVIFRMPENFVTVQYGRVTVFPYDAEKISVMQLSEYDEADNVLKCAVNNGIKLPKDVESVLSYYVVAYRMLKGGGVK